MSFDLNAAETGGGPNTLIPDGTVARAILTIRAGGSGDGGWLKMSKSGGLMLDTEWVIVDGPYAKRKVWRYMSLSESAAPITTRQLRAAVEGHYGIMPNDMSEAAVAKRKVTFEQLNGIEACIMVGIEKGTDGYADKNTIKAVLAPDEVKYIKRGGAAPTTASYGSAQASSAFTPPPAASASSAAKPAWAQ